MYKKFYSRFLEAHKNTTHFACHSHHYWPDITREAQLQYWDDSCKYADDKWNFFFSQKLPIAQRLIAKNIGLTKPEQIAFATNTHELTYRLLTTFDSKQNVSVLTTDSEFYSFDRQINRLSENSKWQITKVPTQSFSDFEDRFIQQIKSKKWDLIFFSHVFFNSGFVCNYEKIVSAIKDSDTIVVVDAYHGFMAIPTDISKVQDRIFYLSGSYKYAQGGEGFCFITVPSSARLRPEYTGWFAEVTKLANTNKGVAYPEGAMQLAGSTLDFTAMYRLIATLELFEQNQITVQTIHDHVQQCQKSFLDWIDKQKHPHLASSQLLNADLNTQGHFLTFEMGSTEKCQEVSAQLKKNNILTDSRGSRLRFGFGLYHDASYGHLTIK